MQTLYGFQSNILQQGCQKKLSKLFFISGHWEKDFAFLTKKKAVGLSKLLSTCLQEQFERNIFFKEKSWISFVSSDMSKKILAFCQIYFDWIVKSVFYEPKRTIRREIFSKKIEKIWVFNSFLDFDQKKKSAFRQGFFGRTEETAVYVSIDKLWGELFGKKNFSLSLLDNEEKKFFRCKPQYSTCPRNILIKFFSGKNVNFLLFVYWAKIFGFFKRFPTGLSKLDLSCPQETLEEKYFFWKNCRCYYRFQKLAKKFRSSDKNFSAGLWKLLLTCL